MKKIAYIILLVSIVSCNVLPKNKTLMLTSNPIELGVVGEQKRNLKKTAYHIFGIPNYKLKIKTSVVVHSFNKSNYKKYLKSIKGKPVKDVVNYIDSIPQKSAFVEIEIIDKVGVVSAINNDNPTIFNYLKKQSNTTLVSKIRLITNVANLKNIQLADAFYLQTLTNKQQYLMVFKDGKLLSKINLYSTQTFGYELSSFCWEVTKRKKIRLATIVTEGENCSNETKRNPDDLIEELTNSSFKF